MDQLVNNGSVKFEKSLSEASLSKLEHIEQTEKVKTESGSRAEQVLARLCPFSPVFSLGSTH